MYLPYPLSPFQKYKHTSSIFSFQKCSVAGVVSSLPEHCGEQLQYNALEISFNLYLHENFSFSSSNMFVSFGSQTI